MRQLENKVAIIIGAGRGIGAAAAVAIGAELDSTGAGRAGAAECDVRDSASVRAGVEAAVDAFGQLDVVVANAAADGVLEFVSAWRRRLRARSATRSRSGMAWTGTPAGIVRAMRLRNLGNAGWRAGR